MVNKRVRNAVLGCNLKNDRMISVRFQGKPFNIMVIQVYAPTSNAEEAEVEQFYEHLQDLLESESEVTQSCLTLSDPMDCSLTGSSVHGISKQAYWSGVPLPSPIEPFNFTFFSVLGKGIDLDYHDIEWFALETNRDHPVSLRLYPSTAFQTFC